MMILEFTEQVIEELTQEGFLINAVKVRVPADNFSSKWVPIDDLETLPEEALVMFVAHNADAITAKRVAYCSDFKWLTEWWKGRWQANI